MSAKLDKYYRSIPKQLKPRINPILNALLVAWAGEDEELETQLVNTNAQLFVKTAEGVYLDRLAGNYGVSRPSELGLLDADFANLIPNLSLKNKQITRAFYDTMDVFWGPLFSRANMSGINTAPFAVAIGESFTVIIDNGDPITISTRIGDIAVPGAATAKEMVRILSRIAGLTPSIITDQNGNEMINIRTNTPGPRGSIEVSSAASFPGIGFVTDYRTRVTDLDQRTLLYQVNPGEIIIEIPATVPTLRRTLKGSHHFHEDYNIEPAIAPDNVVWQGGFLFSTAEQPFLVTSQKAVLTQQVLAGSVINQLTVADSSAIPDTGGKLVFNYGKDNQEQPVDYIIVPNGNTIIVDPGHTFTETHLVGSVVNVLLPNQITPYKPRRNGDDLAIYLTSPSAARAVVQELLRTLTAAGITVTFVVLLPKYVYIGELDNPYAD